MTVTYWERPNTLRDTGQSITLGYGLRGVETKTEARAYALANTDTFKRYLYRSAVEVEEQGPQLFHFDVTWGPNNKREPTENWWKWNFNTAGDTKHITHGLTTATSYVPSGKETIPFKMAINQDGDGNIDGTDIPDRAFAWSEEHNLLLSSYAFSYAQTLGDNKGKTNSVEFRGLPVGTVLFEDASGGPSEEDPEYLTVVYNFRYSPDVENQTVGDITVTTKGGWQYAWVYSEQTADDTSKTTRAIPRQVDVITVFDSFDFTLLGIGTSAPIDWPIA